MDGRPTSGEGTENNDESSLGVAQNLAYTTKTSLLLVKK